MKRIKVLFPFVEAGFGHIMAEKSIADAFEEKYGEHCEVVRSDFYKETGSPAAIKFEEKLCREVRKYNEHNSYGYFSTAAMKFFGRKIASDAVMRAYVPKSYKACVEYMEKLAPDAVVSTHWATNYYAEHLKNKPFTAMYIPDAHVNELFQYDCDLTLTCVEEGYDKAIKLKRRYDDKNLKLTPFAIRKEAFDIPEDKSYLRKKLGHDDKFTVYIMEGGYGIGLAEKISELLLKEDLNISLVVICGKNPELLERLKKLKVGKNTSFYPYGFVDNILEMIASADVYLGKSGSGILEPAFFGVPIVVTHSANTIEKNIAEHYVQAGSAKRIFDAEKCVEFIKKAMAGDAEFEKMKESRIPRDRFGGEGIADIIFAALDEKFNLTSENA